jgi:hypothetical protein
MLKAQAVLCRSWVLPHFTARFLCAAVGDEAAAAQRELDEFFGAQYTPGITQPQHADATSVLAHAAPASHEFHVPNRVTSSAPSNLTHVDESGRATMVDVTHVCSCY